eukprot:TRINITY_DN6680_c0_g1_i1.p1 TRINITY_DN6680_c0_g1~~TRINITY_DN6680_c0_g1_i1.p1  ORF type:complete len:103 (+),score=15.31 TRINITY_DN6680_c0_g1_i1:87-395(+)
MFLSPVLLRSKSRRLAITLVSSAQTGYRYFTEKSPLKKETRVALHKYDPIVDRYVMFYETPINRPVRRVRLPRPIAWARWTGIGLQDLVKSAQKKYEKKGHF